MLILRSLFTVTQKSSPADTENRICRRAFLHPVPLFRNIFVYISVFSQIYRDMFLLCIHKLPYDLPHDLFLLRRKHLAEVASGSSRLTDTSGDLIYDLFLQNRIRFFCDRYFLHPGTDLFHIICKRSHHKLFLIRKVQCLTKKKQYYRHCRPYIKIKHRQSFPVSQSAVEKNRQSKKKCTKQ